MAHHDGLGDAELVEHPDEIPDEVQLRVLVDALGRIGLPVAALVGRDHVVTGVAERAELMAPGVPALGEPVAQHHGRAVSGAGLGEVHADAVGVHEPLADEGKACGGRRVGCGGHGASLAHTCPSGVLVGWHRYL